MKPLRLLPITLLTILMTVSLLAGSQAKKSKADSARRKNEKPVATIPWNDLIGQKLTLVGRGENAKIGAKLACEDFSMYVDLPAKGWPKKVYNRTYKNLDAVPKKVRVTGKLEQWSDVPVFHKSKDRGRQGIPVPDGTDLKEARKRYILVDVVWDIVTEKDPLTKRDEIVELANKQGKKPKP